MAPSGRDHPVVSLQQERERTIELLGEHFAHDNLSLEDLERRIEQAYRAADIRALRDLTRDLPTAGTAVAPQPVAADRAVEVYAPEEGRIVSIMSNTKRRGVWQPPRFLDVWSVMSETILDLTKAMMVPGVTEIDVHGLMTSVKLIVPHGVRVVTQVGGFMSEVSDQTEDPPPVGSGAPVVRITGFVVMAELKVVVRRREQPADLS